VQRGRGTYAFFVDGPSKAGAPGPAATRRRPFRNAAVPMRPRKQSCLCWCTAARGWASGDRRTRVAGKKSTTTRAVAQARGPLPAGYASFLDALKARIRAAQVKAALAVNAELVLLYWRVGRDILARQEQKGWGARVIDRLSADLHAAFPEMKGFSPRNLKYMRAFAEAWPDEEIVQQAVARLPWGHNVRLLDRIESRDERLWYARQAIEHGWSRAVLEAQIETDLHRRAGKALTNFKATLAPPHSDLASRP
jgi:predicted nuclease of restriction endonuclease-like (RecB) superfamily